MEYLRIGAINPPETGKAPWARDILIKALDAGVMPARVPAHEVVGFTANLPPHLASIIKMRSVELDMSPARLTAGLIFAFEQHVVQMEDPPKQHSTVLDSRLAKVRPVLHQLTEKTTEAIHNKKVVFAEAATGTGKGRMICYHALNAIAHGQRAVVSAPVNIMWKLITDLKSFDDHNTARLAVILGRPNFVSPSALDEWATQADCKPVMDWIEAGAKPISESAIYLSKLIGIELCWLMDDAMSLTENIPAQSVMLGEDSDEDACPAQAVYEKTRERLDSSNLVLMSHHMLAFHCRALQFKSQPVLNWDIDVLLVDEAHDLESAFSSIFSQTSHIHGFISKLDLSTAGGKLAAKKAAVLLGDHIQAHIENAAKTKKNQNGADYTVGPLYEYPHFVDPAKTLLESLESLKVKKNDSETSRTVNRIKSVLRNALSGMATIKLEITPIKRYPLITVGQSNLEKAFKILWSKTKSCALFSATLYTNDLNAGLMRWKLSVPKERIIFLPPVIPAWVKKPVLLHRRRVHTIPDGSDQWHHEVAHVLSDVSRNARGGVLFLSTSYATIDAVAELLRNEFEERLITQSMSQSASLCRQRFMTHPGKPIWLATGSAWRGVDLSNSSLGYEDHTLSDLVIPRLPFGLNRTLTHHRRTQVAGNSVNITEAIWAFRQGIGRLVRSDKVPPKHLWVLDARLEIQKPWLSSFRSVLKGYTLVD